MYKKILLLIIFHSSILPFTFSRNQKVGVTALLSLAAISTYYFLKKREKEHLKKVSYIKEFHNTIYKSQKEEPPKKLCPAVKSFIEENIIFSNFLKQDGSLSEKKLQNKVKVNELYEEIKNLETQEKQFQHF